MAVQNRFHETFQPELPGDDENNNGGTIPVFKSQLQLTSEKTTDPPIKVVEYVVNLTVSLTNTEDDRPKTDRTLHFLPLPSNNSICKIKAKSVYLFSNHMNN